MAVKKKGDNYYIGCDECGERLTGWLTEEGAKKSHDKDKHTHCFKCSSKIFHADKAHLLGRDDWEDEDE